MTLKVDPSLFNHPCEYLIPVRRRRNLHQNSSPPGNSPKQAVTKKHTKRNAAHSPVKNGTQNSKKTEWSVKNSSHTTTVFQKTPKKLSPDPAAVMESAPNSVNEVKDSFETPKTNCQPIPRNTSAVFNSSECVESSAIK